MMIGSQQAHVDFAGVSESGLDQFNVTVPSGLPDGDAALVATVSGVSTQPNVFVTVAETGLSLQDIPLSFAFISTLNLTGSTINIEQRTLKFGISASPEPDGTYNLQVSGDSTNRVGNPSHPAVSFFFIARVGLSISGKTATFTGPVFFNGNYIDGTSASHSIQLPLAAVTFTITFTDLEAGSPIAGNIGLSIFAPNTLGLCNSFWSACSGTLQGTFSGTL